MTRLSPLAWRLRRCLLALEREKILLAEVWACLLGVAPELTTASNRRQRLRDTIDELVAESWLVVPDHPNAYDHKRDPPLPRSVRIVLSTQRATRMSSARGAAWRPELLWAANVRLSPQAHNDLLRINAWLDRHTSRVIVPPRERSLELFGPGHEDRLYELARSELFGGGRLTWDLLACAPVSPPFVCSPVGPGSWLLVVSGHETFASVRRALVEAPATPIGLVAHGAAGYFASAVASAWTLDRTVERILYYGDLDAADLRTPQRASQVALREGLPAVEPATAFYELLLAHGRPSATRPLHVTDARALAAWMPQPLRGNVTSLLVGGRRLAQEWVGYERLISERIWRALEAPPGADDRS
jgi:hypothetical protein